MTNYGDELSRLIVERVLGTRVSWASMRSADVVALGSILDLYQTNNGSGKIWGSGIADPDRDFNTARIESRVIGVRGPLTRDRLKLGPSTALGDPGLLSPEFWTFGERRAGLKVLVPHYSAYATTEGRDAVNMLRQDGYTVAPPNIRPEAMMELIARAQFVASSGLHGVILAHAYGTPSTLISLKSGVPQQPVFKYRDFFASIEIEPRLVSWKLALSDHAEGLAERDLAHQRLDEARDQVRALVQSLHGSSVHLAD